MIKSLKFGDKVEVQWRDAHSKSDIWVNVGTVIGDNGKDAIMYRIGYVVDVTTKYLALASVFDFCDNWENKGGQCGQILHIPVSECVSIRKLGYKK